MKEEKIHSQMEIKSKNDKKIINRIKKLIIDYSKDNKNKHFFS